MKNSKYKTLTLLAAIIMTLSFVNLVLRHDIVCRFFPVGYSVGQELYFAIWNLLAFVSMIITIVAVLSTKETHLPSKSFSYATYIVAVIFLVRVIHAFTFLPPYILPMERRILLLFGTIWLWLLWYQNGVSISSRPLRIAMVIGATLLCLPLILQFISGLSYLINGKLLFLHSWEINAWMKRLIPTILLSWYSIELYKNNRRKRV